jgi:hypothetical protein
MAIDHGHEDFDPEDGIRAGRIARILKKIEDDRKAERHSNGILEIVGDVFGEGCAAGCSAMIVFPIAITALVYVLL